MHRCALVLVALTLVAGCAHQSSQDLEGASLGAEDTKFGPGDVFEVRVLGQNDLTGRFRVGPDGNIDYPYLGTIPAGGKEPGDLARDIAAGLKDRGFYRDPQVSVLMVESNSKRLSVLGAVAKPGTFPMLSGMTVIQAVSQAGGFTPLANKDGTVVTRRQDGKLERFRVPIEEITRGNQADFPLRAGDIVFVPERVF